MGELNIQIKVLKKTSPVLFSWWNKDLGAAEGCLVVCPCQDLNLLEGPGSPRKGKTERPMQGTLSTSWSLRLGEALHKAEILTIPVESDISGISSHANTISFLGSDPAHLREGQGGRTRKQKRKADRNFRKGNEKVEFAQHVSVQEAKNIDLAEDTEDADSEIEGRGGLAEDEVQGISDDEETSNFRDGTERAATEAIEISPAREAVDGGGVVLGSTVSADSQSKQPDYGDRYIRGEVSLQEKSDIAITFNSLQEIPGHGLGARTPNISDVSDVVGRQMGTREDCRQTPSDAETVMKSNDTQGVAESEQLVRIPCIAGASEVMGSQTLTIIDGVFHAAGSTSTASLLDRQLVDNSGSVTPGNQQLSVGQGSSATTVGTHSLPQEPEFALMRSPVTPVDNVSPDSIVVMQDGHEMTSEVDRALLEVLKGLLKPHTTPQEILSEHRSDDHQGDGLSTELKDTKPEAGSVEEHAINTPAMVRYREHQTQQYLKKLHQTTEGGTDMTVCEVCGAILSVRQLRKHISHIHSTAEPRRDHECGTCGKRFYKPDSLVRHEKTHSEPAFHCKHCTKSFRHNFQLQNHRKLHAGHELPKRIHKPRYKSSNPKPRRVASVDGSLVVVDCPVCQVKIGTRSLGRHLKMKHSDVPCGRFSCTDCEKKFTTKSRLHTHTLTHKGLQFYCGFCRLLLGDDLERVRHERTHPSEQSGVKFKCGFCQKTYSRVRDRLRHEMAHFDSTIDLSHGTRDREYQTVNKPVQCPLCDKTLKQNSMRAHMDSHNGKTWTCQVCGKTISKGARYDHLKLHSGSKQHFCDICPSSFFTKHALIAHLRTHTQEKPVACRYCDRKFARYEGRNNHEREHTGERPYGCDKCGKTWKDRPTYVQHMKRHHPHEPLMTRKRRGAALLPRLPGVPVDE